MAERRMFAKTIIDSDAFLSMPLSAQSLYFHLAMRADDEGFVNSPKKIQRMIGASEDDGNILLMRRFILAFDSGVIVIKHWRIHNYLRNDRFKPTIYQEEKSKISLKENGAYTDETLLGIPNGYQMDTQDSIDKDRKDKVSIDYKGIQTLFNEICPSFPKITVLNDKRKTLIKARIEKYGIEKLKEVFEKAEASEFLKGNNNRCWSATFDWLMEDRNFIKVLEGNYDKNKNQYKGKSPKVELDSSAVDEDWQKIQKAANEWDDFDKLLTEEDYD